LIKGEQGEGSGENLSDRRERRIFGALFVFMEQALVAWRNPPGDEPPGSEVQAP